MNLLLGLIVNPVAGMGGAVGLHGTDGSARLAEAIRRGAGPIAKERALRAVRRIDSATTVLVVANGPMGADVAKGSDLEFKVLDLEVPEVTTAAHTRAVARTMVDAGCRLIMFVGGDGTALDVAVGAGTEAPIVGVPSGVKMRSGVFATTPETAGDIAKEFLSARNPVVIPADLIDIDEGGQAECLRGVVTTPRVGGGRLTRAKVSTVVGSRAEMEALCNAVADELEDDTLYLVGPGSTTGEVLGVLGLEGTALGIDAVVDRRLVGRDLSESEILRLMDRYSTAKLLLGVVGGQGFLLGRGNQQLSSRVIGRLAPEDITILSSSGKLFELAPPVLWVDAGQDVTERLVGYRHVRVAPRRSVLMRVAGRP